MHTYMKYKYTSIRDSRDSSASGGRIHPERPAGRAGAGLSVALGAADLARAAVGPVGGSHQWLGAGDMVAK